jgi:hypothetical protein
MAATGVITGRVRDSGGELVGPVTILATQVVYENGRKTFRIVRGVTTDDRGEYRLFWLPPGTYYVAARVEDPKRRSTTLYIGHPGRYRGTVSAQAPVISQRILPDGNTFEEAYSLVYFGGVVDAEKAQPVDLSPGGSVAGVDIFMGPGTIPSHHLRGSLIDGRTGQPIAGIEVRAIPLQPAPSLIVPVGTTDEKGAFDLGGVIPGRYAVTTLGGGLSTAGPLGFSAQSGPVATAFIDHGDADLNGLRLVAENPFELSGRVRVEGRLADGKDVDLSAIRVALSRDPDLLGMPGIPAGGNAGGVASTGVFTLRAVPGEFKIVVNGIPPNAYVKSIFLGADNVLHGTLRLSGSPANSLDVVIGTDAGEVTGIAVSDRREPMSNVIVALVPDSQIPGRPGFYSSTTSDESGRFQIRNIPPGDYKVFCWEYAEAGAWQNESFLKPYEALGKPIVIGRGTRQETQVTPVPLVRP